MKQLWDVLPQCTLMPGHHLCFSLMLSNVFSEFKWLWILGIKMCSLATFRPLGCRQRAQYKNNRIWSHLSKQWDWEFFIAVCSEFVGVATVCQGRAWADVISKLVAVSLESKPRQMGMTGLQWFPHLDVPQDLEVCCRMHLPFSEDEVREN